MSGYLITRKKSRSRGSKIPGISQEINPDPRDFGIFGNFHSGFFRDFEIPIPILGISGFLGVRTRDFFGVFRGFKIPIPIPGIFGFSEFFTRDFFGILKSRSRSLGFRDFLEFSLGLFSGFLEV